MVLNLSRGLMQDKVAEIEPHIFVYDEVKDAPSLVPEFEKAGITVHKTRKGFGFSPRVLVEMVRVILHEDIFVVHTHDLSPLIYATLAKMVTFNGGVTFFL